MSKIAKRLKALESNELASVLPATKKQYIDQPRQPRQQSLHGGWYILLDGP